jgi:hypothetical protein
MLTPHRRQDWCARNGIQQIRAATEMVLRAGDRYARVREALPANGPLGALG